MGVRFDSISHLTGGLSVEKMLPECLIELDAVD